MSVERSVSRLSRALAMAMLAGEWETPAMLERATSILGHEPPWLAPLVRRMRKTFVVPPRDDVDALVLAVAARAAVRRSVSPPHECPVRRWLVDEPTMGSEHFAVPPLATTGELGAWLGLTPSELDFLADLRQLGARTTEPKLRHYTVRFLPKATGGVRVVEAPKGRLKAIQRRILREILDAVPPHDAAHGFVRGRSVATHAALHARRAVVVRLDLEDFFPSIRASRVHATFRALGYPTPVARALTALTTTITPRAAWRAVAQPTDARELQQRFHQRQRHAERHLPQGAPTSPALANLTAYGLDVRLAALASALDGTYSRYADDFVLSGDDTMARAATRLVPRIAAIALEEGFRVRHDKTRVMRASVRQEICGLVVNASPRPERRELEQLEAILFNCVRDGASANNRAALPDFRAHLAGRIAWIAAHDPTRGARMRELFGRVAW